MRPKPKLTKREEHLKNKYGMTEEDYNFLLEKQNFRCDICKTHISKLNEVLHVDHCHVFGQVRGLLCRKCNYGLGCFEDRIKFLENAIKYLHKGRFKLPHKLEED